MYKLTISDEVIKSLENSKQEGLDAIYAVFKSAGVVIDEEMAGLIDKAAFRFKGKIVGFFNPYGEYEPLQKKLTQQDYKLLLGAMEHFNSLISAFGKLINYPKGDHLLGNSEIKACLARNPTHAETLSGLFKSLDGAELCTSPNIQKAIGCIEYLSDILDILEWLTESDDFTLTQDDFDFLLAHKELSKNISAPLRKLDFCDITREAFEQIKKNALTIKENSKEEKVYATEVKQQDPVDPVEQPSVVKIHFNSSTPDPIEERKKALNNKKEQSIKLSNEYDSYKLIPVFSVFPSISSEELIPETANSLLAHT